MTTSPNLQTGLNGDPKVEGFVNGSDLRIAVTQYDYINEPPVAQPVKVYNAETATSVASTTWNSVKNLYTLAKLGSYLYAIDYDNALVAQIDASTYAETGKTFSLAGSGVPIPPGFKPYGQALIVIGSDLYGLFSFANADWTEYKNSVLVKFTIGTTITVGTNDYNNTLEKNAFSLAVYGSDIYVAAIGGKQGNGTYNPNSKVQKIAYTGTLGSATVQTVLTTSNFTGEFRDISFNSNGTAYVLYGNYNSSWQLAGKLVAIANLGAPTVYTTVNDFSSGANGYFWSAQYTADNQRIWFARGNDVLLYNASSNALVTTIGIAALAGGGLYDSLNDLSYVGAVGDTTSLRGYRSPLQASNTPRARAARALTRGRPELTDEELQQLADK